MSEAGEAFNTLIDNLHQFLGPARRRLALKPSDLDELADLAPGTIEAIEAGDAGGATLWDLQRLAKTAGLTHEGMSKRSNASVENDVC